MMLDWREILLSMEILMEFLIKIKWKTVGESTTQKPKPNKTMELNPCYKTAWKMKSGTGHPYFFSAEGGQARKHA